MSDVTQTMPFWEHLTELRKRLLFCFLGVVVGFGIAYAFSADLFRLLVVPYNSAYLSVFQKEPILIATGVVETFMVYVKVALISGFFLASPFIFLQIWLFIEPALKPGEKSHAVPLIVLATLFFVGGALFGYFGVFPLGFRYFLQIAPPDQVQTMLKMDEYFSFASWMLFSFGVIFEVPLLLMYLTYVGIVPVSVLAKHWRLIVVAIAILSAVLTPSPDAATMILMMVPLLVLYGITLLVGFVVGKKRRDA
jgi:sec-independent protein translocase protein TatC